MQMKIPSYLSPPHWLCKTWIWKINLDRLKSSAPILFLKSNLNMKKKTIFFSPLECAWRHAAGANNWQITLECGINQVPQVSLLIL